MERGEWLMKSIEAFLICCSFMSVPGIAGAVDIQAAPAPFEANKPSSPQMDKQNFNVGPRDSQKEKALGVWLNFYENKKLSVGCGLSLVPQVSLLRSGQSGNNSGLGSENVRGCFGIKYSFH